MGLMKEQSWRGEKEWNLTKLGYAKCVRDLDFVNYLWLNDCEINLGSQAQNS